MIGSYSVELIPINIMSFHHPVNLITIKENREYFRDVNDKLVGLVHSYTLRFTKIRPTIFPDVFLQKFLSRIEYQKLKLEQI